MIERVRGALAQLPQEVRDRAQVVYTAHSIPTSMSQTCAYVQQLGEASRLVSEGLGRVEIAWYSRVEAVPPLSPGLSPSFGLPT